MSRKRPALSPAYAAALGVPVSPLPPAPVVAPGAAQAPPRGRQAEPRAVKVTVSLDAALVAELRAAVAALPRTYSLAGVVAEAVRRELARLAKQHGPFPPGPGRLRPGRPVGR